MISSTLFWRLGRLNQLPVVQNPVVWVNKFYSTRKNEDGAESDVPNPVSVGDQFELEKKFNESDLSSFAQISGDLNPIHFDKASAQAAGLHSPVVNGILCASLFPSIIGSKFPGAIYVSQSLSFKSPVFLNELILAKVQVMDIRRHKHRFKVTFSTTCFKVNEGIQSLDGSAIALLPFDDTQK